MSNDTIKRSDAIKAAEDGMCTFYDCDVLDRLNAAPSADRPSGEWIITESHRKGQIIYHDYKCSICGHHRDRRMNYCEICGAMMKGVDND